MKESTFTNDVLKLIEALQKNKFSPQDLTLHQRKKIILYFLEEQSSESNRAIGRLIGISGQAVGQQKNSLLKNSAWEIEDINVKIVAVSLKKKKEEYQRRAMKKDDIRLAWQMEIDYIEKMQSLGFIYEAPKKIQGEFKTTLSMVNLKKSTEDYDESDSNS